MRDAPKILPFPTPAERVEKEPREKIRYVEFAVASNFSFLRGASHPEELMLQADHLELAGLGLCDRNSVAGVVRAHLIKRDKKLPLRYHPGVRLVFADGTSDILAYPRDRPAWGRLCRLLTAGNLRAEKGDCILYLDDLLAHIEGLELIVMPDCTRDVAAKLLHKSRSFFGTDEDLFRRKNEAVLAVPPPLRGRDREGGKRHARKFITTPLPTPPPRASRMFPTCATIELLNAGTPAFSWGREHAAARGTSSTAHANQSRFLHRLREAAPGRVRLAAAMLYRGNDRARLASRVKLAHEADIPLIAVNDVLYHHHERRELQDVLTCIREHVTIDTAGRKLAVNAERYLKPATEMARLSADYPEAITETIRLSDALTFSLDELKYEYPDESIAGFATAQEALEHLTWEGAKQRYPEGITDAVRKSLANEFTLIASRQYAPYFLTVYDIVRFAREQGILCQGRGSAANSTVCYCLGVTSVDPVRGDLLFERFISTERHEPPDIDVDFEHERREEVIQYIYGKYGRDRTGIAATVISYRGRSAIREVGKAFGLSEDMIGALASSIWGMGGGNVRRDALQRAGLDPESLCVAKIIAIAKEIQGFPRHLSQHVGGFVITRSRLDEVIPIMNGAMEARTHVEWDKDDLDALGILKVDVLGLGMLSCLRKGFELADKHYPGWNLPLPSGEVTSSLEGEVDQHKLAWADREGGTPQSSAQDSTPLPIPPPHASRMFPTCATIEWPTSKTSDVGGGREPAANCGKAPVSSKENPFTSHKLTPLASPPPLRGRDREGGNSKTLSKPQRARAFELSDVPAEEPAVYDMLCRADSIGVFQVESRAQMSMLPRLKPRKFYDLVIEVAIVRPGPIQGDMVHPYLIRREKLRETGEEPNYPSPSPEHGDPNELRDVLKKTLGVPLFQEQAMKIAIVAGGFTPGEADKLRRAMATFKRTGTIGTFRDKMIHGMTAKGYDPDFAERCFSQIEGFGEYGFPESHAASFALLVYASAWLKCRYPDVFAAALLNSQPMGFYAPAQIVRDAREHGVEVRPVDINHSGYDNTLELGLHAAGRLHALHREMARDIRSTHAMRLGFREIKGISEDDAKLIVSRRILSSPPPLRGRSASEASREGTPQAQEQVSTPLPTPPPQGGRESSEQASEAVPYISVRDVWLRTGLSTRVLERFADADAFGSLGLSRRQALWAVKALGRAGDQDDLPLMQHQENTEAAALASPPPFQGSKRTAASGDSSSHREPAVTLPPMPLGEEVVNDYRFLKLSLRAHPASFLRADLAARCIIVNAELRTRCNGEYVRVSGLVTIRQRPGSANGVIFMTIEDETAIANLIVWPKTFERFRPIVLGARYVCATGRMQQQSGVIHVVADRLEDLTPLLGQLMEDAPPIEAYARADEVKGQQSDPRDRTSRAERYASFAENIDVAADLGITAPGSAHAPTRKAAPKMR